MTFYFRHACPKKIVKTCLLHSLLHGPSMFAVKAKNYAVLYDQAGAITSDVPSSYWSALKSS